jgi:hypothetical protein
MSGGAYALNVAVTLDGGSALVLEVTPGNARIKAGSALAIRARLVGNRAPIIAQVQMADGDRWRGLEMSTDAPGSFRFGVDAVTAPFKYRVAAGPLTSPVYEVAVAHAPRVKRIDVEYTYPAVCGAAADRAMAAIFMRRRARRSRARVHRSSGGHRRDDARRRQASRADIRRADRAVRVAESRRRQFLPCRAG